MTIELSFVTEDTFGSKLIKWFTHSDFSHVDIITPDGYRLGARTDHPVDKDLAVGVQKRPMDYAEFTVDQRLIIPCSATQADYAYCWAYDQIGKPYDKEGLLRSFLFNSPRSVDWWDENQWWCSELAAVFIHNGTDIRCATPASRVSPNDAFLFGSAVRDARSA